MKIEVVMEINWLAEVEKRNYSEMGKKRETFYKFLKRIGKDQLIGS